MKRSNLLQSTRKSGFALIITIVLVAFLVLILVGLATFTRVETQVASNAQDMAKARQNALMALNIAIGELQVAAGPDSRVTAPAEATPAATVLGLGLPAAPAAAYVQADWTDYETDLNAYWGNGAAWRSPQWVGAWRNVVAPPNVAPRLINWLVSGNEQVWDPVTAPAGHTTPPFTPSQTVLGLDLTKEAAALSPTVNGRPGVVLVGNRSTSGNVDPSAPVTPAEADRYVVAPKVDISGPLPDGSTGVIGRYAWWVGDQGVKAALNAAYRPDVFPALSAWQEQVNGMQSTGRAGLEVLWGTNFDSNPNWLKVSQLSQASFAPTAPNAITPGEVREHFHDVGALSYGLLTDTLNGGFKIDLTTTPTALPPELGGINLTNFFPTTATAALPADGVLTVPAVKTDPDLNAWAGPMPDQLPAPFQDRTFNGTVSPVVADARLTLKISYNAGQLEIRKGTELLLWNPYTADFTWTQIQGGNIYRNGYRYRVQWSYALGDNSGLPWDGQVSVGYVYTDGVNSLSNGISTVDLDLFGPDTHLDPFFLRPGFTVLDVISAAPGSHILDSIAPTFARLRAGETALYQQIEGAIERLSRTTDLFGYSNDTSLDKTVTFSAPPAPAVALEARPMLHFAAAGVPTRKIGLAVYARKVNELGNDVPNAGADADNGPTGSKEVLIFSQSFDLTLSTPPVAPLSTADLINSWQNRITPGVFAGTASLVSFNPGSLPTTTTGTDFYATFHARNVVNTVGSFWQNYDNLDPRDVGARSFALTLDEGLLTTSSSTFSWVGFDTSISAQLPQIPANPLLTRDHFPILFEAARDEPVSLLQLGAAPNIGGVASYWLGLAPNFATNSLAITNLNQAVLDKYYFSTIRAALIPGDISTERLRNKRYELAPIQGRTNNQNHNYLTAVGGRPPAAALRVVAPFNINSVSESAWAAQLASGGQSLVGVVWDKRTDEFYARTDNVGSNVGRFRQAPGMAYSFRVREQSSQAPNGEGSIYRNGLRELGPLDLYARTTQGMTNPTIRLSINVNDQVTSSIPNDFAKIVRQANLVRVGRAGANAGPAFSIAEFANTGVLETAIRNVQWTVGGGGSYTGLNWERTTNAAVWNDFSTLQGTPSCLSQRDLLQALAPVLSARSDTFVIRTYGEAVNPASPNEVVGKVWCEAIVVRSADYVDDVLGEEPEDAFLTLNATNQNFGRRFRIISFRWLDANDL